MTQKTKEKGFGQLLREYREKSYDHRAEKRLSQKRLAILLTDRTGIIINRNKVGEWERDKSSIDHEDRMILTGLISILHLCGGIDTMDEANQLLEKGFYSDLGDEEKKQINPDWIVDPETDDILNSPESIEELFPEFSTNSYDGSQSIPMMAPPPPEIIVGREETLRDLKNRLGISKTGKYNGKHEQFTVMQGWPGVGKTTITALLAHDKSIENAFPDGVLWVSLNQDPQLLSELAAWGGALGTEEILRMRNLEDAVKKLIGLLKNKRMLLIVDDAWEAVHAIPFKIGSPGCAIIVTTRLNEVAQEIAATPNQIFKLEVLSDDKALELLDILAPEVVTSHPDEALQLVRELEGLPLAIQVAGRMLHVEAALGFSVVDLIIEIREGAKLLEAKAPPDRVDLEKEIIPTVVALLRKSTDRLGEEIRDRFAFLGPFAPKPATFDAEAMKAVWQIDDPKPTVRILVARGLLEPVPETERFQMHALLVMLARSLLKEG